MSLLEHSESRSTAAELLRWSVSSSEGETTVALAGEIDLACDGTLKQLLADVVDAHPAKIAIDLTNVTFLDSTGIRRLVSATNAASEFGCRVVVRHPTATIERTLEICGLRELLLEDPAGTQPEGR